MTLRRYDRSFLIVSRLILLNSTRLPGCKECLRMSSPANPTLSSNGISTSVQPAMPSLYDLSVSRFDNLTKQSSILYRPYTTTHHKSSTFPAAFQLAPHLGYKPVLPADAPERRANNSKSNPFSNPDPSFVLPFESDTHTLILNKYCVYRPQLLLVTKNYRPQYEALDDTDVKAGWDLICQLESDTEHKHGTGRMLAFYNCGAESGSSQGHKHVQVMPRPEADDIGFDLFPDTIGEEYERDIAENVRGVPHRHFVLKLPRNATVDHAIVAHRRLLEKMREFLDRQKWHEGSHTDDPPHNVIMTKEWVCVVPRRDSGIQRHAMSNALGMLGVFWITHDSQVYSYTELWDSLDEHMQFLGFPA